MSEDEKIVYAEAGQWLRLTNTVAWTMAAFLLSVLQAPILLAMTTGINRWVLFAASVVVVLFWIYFEGLYQQSADRARLLLLKLEQRAGFIAPKLYSEQQALVPKGWRHRSPRLMDLLALYAFLLAGVWAWLLLLAVPTLLPSRPRRPR